MLHDVHQFVANVVRLPFGAGQLSGNRTSFHIFGILLTNGNPCFEIWDVMWTFWHYNIHRATDFPVHCKWLCLFFSRSYGYTSSKQPQKNRNLFTPKQVDNDSCASMLTKKRKRPCFVTQESSWVTLTKDLKFEMYSENSWRSLKWQR